jgi:hypothetical protein
MSEATELLDRIVVHHSVPFVAERIGVSTRALEMIRLGKVAASPDTVRRLRELAEQGPKHVEVMRYRLKSDRRW